MKQLSRLLLLTVLLGAIWVATVSFGMRVLRPSVNKSSVASAFPRDAAIYLATHKPTLILFADAGSTTAGVSIDEFARTVAELGDRVKAYVLVSAVTGLVDENNERQLWDIAAAIPEVIPVGDAQGREARRFGALASGHTLLFAPDGRLLASGAIAEAREYAVRLATEDALALPARTASRR